MKLSIFISSPGDVGEERRLAGRVLERLTLEFAGRVTPEPVFWEHEPLRATATFQEEIPRPSASDVVVVILWSRLGTRLPEHIRRPDGTAYASGTEFEFEDAALAFRQKGLPDLLVYRKTARPVTPLDSEAEVLERLRQKQALDAFVERWFQGADGSFQAAFHAFETPAAFEEQLEHHLRRLLTRRLEEQGEAGGRAPAAPVWTRGSPFRGLEAFEYEHATVFCGRTRAVSEVLDRLRRQAAEDRPFVLVLGMSGCGKSSLVRAGVLPQLTQPGVIEGIGLWRRAAMRPGDGADPFLALATALLEEAALPELALGSDARALADSLREGPRAVAAMIRQTLAQAARKVQEEEGLARPPAARLALLVDQLEEVFTHGRITDADRAAFAEALAALARSGDVWILATLRSDFYDGIAKLPTLVALKEGPGQYDLLPPTPAEIAQMIRMPARMAGLDFEEDPDTDASLDDVLRDAAATDPEALPLLEFALDALYEQRTDEGRLTFAAYRALGGIEGALAGRAEATYAALPASVQAAAPRVFEALVRFGLDDKENAVRRRAPREAAAPTPEAEAFVDAFVGARLFAADRAPDGGAEVTLAHEALLRHWPRLADWVEGNRERLRARARVAAAAAIWAEEDEAPEHLLGRGHLLDEGAAILAERRAELEAREVRFLEASLGASRRARRRRRLQVGALLAALLVAALAGWTYYDQNVRVHVAHHPETVHQWGVPRPVGPALSGKALRARAGAIRIRRRGDRVLEIATVRGSGGLLAEHEGGSLIGRWDPEAGTQRECIWSYRYFEDGTVSDEIARNQYGQVVHHLRYPQGHRGRETVIAQYVSEGLPSSQTPSGAAFVEITRDARGYRTRMRYIDHERRTLPNEQGSYGERWETDAQGRVVRLVNLGRDGEPHPDRRGVTETRFERDGEGRVVWTGTFDGEGRPVTVPTGFAAVRTEHDQAGNPARFVWLDAAGAPVRTRGGWASLVRERDANGHLVREAYFDPDGAPLDRAWGPAEVRMETDARGEITSWACFDASGAPTRGLGGFFASITRVERDRYGNTVRLMNFGVDGEPIAHPDGNYGYEAEYDERGNRVAMRYLDAAGDPTLVRDGYAAIRTRYDERNHPVETVTVGLDGHPVRSEGGFAIQREVRDRRGNTTRATYHHPDGSPAVSAYGNAAFEAEHDDFGQLVEERYLGCDGELLRMPTGFAAMRNRYDERGRLVERIYLDRDLKPVRTTWGYASVRHEHDAHGRVVETRHFAPDGTPVRSEEGVHGERRVLDAQGRTVETRFLGPDGGPTLDVHGVGRVRHVYDDHGNEVRRTWHDTKGAPTFHADLGDAGWQAEYDASGNRTRQTWLGLDGEPAPTRDGVTTVRRRYDDRHRLVEERYEDADGAAAYHREGMAIVRYERGARHEVLRALNLDAEGEPLLRVDGTAGERGVYDENGARLEQTWLGSDGEPLARADGLAGWRATYDARGWLDEQTWVDAEGLPSADENGCTGFRLEHDRNGNVTVRTFLGPDGKPCLRADGWAVEKNTYDENGETTSTRVFGPDGAPATLPDGSHGRRFRREDDGRAVVQISIDAEGEPVETTDGAAGLRNVYDEAGRWILMQYEDAQGHAVAARPGFAALASTYDDWGRETSVTVLDADGKPMTGPSGYAIEERTFDPWGRRVALRRSGPEGRLLEGDAVAAIVRRTFDRHGNETSVAVFDARGEPWTESGGVHATHRTYDAAGNVTSEAFVGGAGEAVTGPGVDWARATFAYDARHNRIETRTFDTAGEPLAPPGRGSVVRARYDAARRQVEEAHFDGDGAPVAVAALGGAHRHVYTFGRTGGLDAVRIFQPDGTSERRHFDAAGGVLERTWLDSEGRPSDARYGFARQVRVSGDWARPYDFRDAGGDPVEVDLDVVVVGVVPDGAGARAGIRAGDVIERYDGRRVPDDLTLRHWVFWPAEERRSVTLRRDGETFEATVPPGPLGVYLDIRAP